MKYRKLLLLIALLGASCVKTPDNNAEINNCQTFTPTQFKQLDSVILNITFDSYVNFADVEIPELKFGKQAVFNIEWDDNTRDALTGFNILSNYTYTDGTGKALPYTAAIGINAYSFSDAEIGCSQNDIRYSEYPKLIDKGWDLMNHSSRHKDKPQISDYTEDLLALNNLYQEKTCYTPNCFIVPANYYGFVPEAEDLGFLVSSSTGHNTYKPKHPPFDQVGNVDNFEANSFLQLNRDFNDDWQDLNRINNIKAKFTQMMNGCDDSIHLFYRLGTHFTDSLQFVALFDHFQSEANDHVWFTTAREWMEYRLVRDRATIETSVNGKVLTLKIYYSDLPSSLRWGDLSLKVKSNGSIVNVSSTSPIDDITYNQSTGMVNVYNQVPYSSSMSLSSFW